MGYRALIDVARPPSRTGLLLLFVLAADTPASASIVTSPHPPPPMLYATKDAASGAVVLTAGGGTAPYDVIRSDVASFYSSATSVLVSGSPDGRASDPSLADTQSYYYGMLDAFDGPFITWAEPLPVRRGEALTIRGTGFGGSPAENFVLLGGESLTISAAAPDRIEAMVGNRTVSGNLAVYSAPAGGEAGVDGGIHVPVAVAGPYTFVSGMVTDAAHQLYVADRAPTGVLYKLDPEAPGSSCSVTQLNWLSGLDIDGAGNLYFGTGYPDLVNIGSIYQVPSGGCDLTAVRWARSGCSASCLIPSCFFPACPSLVCDPTNGCLSEPVRVWGLAPDAGSPPTMFVADTFGNYVRRVAKDHAGPAAPEYPNPVTTFLFRDPAAIAVDRNPASPSFNHLFVGVGRMGSPPVDVVEEYDLATGSLVRTFTEGIDGPTAIEVTPDGFLLVANRDASSIVAIHLASGDSFTLTDRIPSPSALAFDLAADGRRIVYAASADPGTGEHWVLAWQMRKVVHLDAKILEGAADRAWVERSVRLAGSVWAQCGLDVVLDAVQHIADPNAHGGFVESSDGPCDNGPSGCLCPVMTAEEDVLGASRSADPNAVNAYVARCWEFPNGTCLPSRTPPGAVQGRAYSMTKDGTLDEGTILVTALRPPLVVLAHELGHLLLDDGSCTTDEHTYLGLPPGYLMVAGGLLLDPRECADVLRPGNRYVAEY